MNEYEKELIAKRANAWEESKKIIDAAEAEKRALTGEEQASLQKTNETLDALRASIDAVQRLNEERKAIDAASAAVTAAPKDEARTNPAEADASEAALEASFRAMVEGEKRELKLKMNKAQLREVNGLTETRANTKLTAAAGANTVPISFYGRLWANLIQTASLLAGGATAMHTDSGEQIQFPITTGFSTAALVAEAGTIPGSDPSFGQRSLNAYKYGVLLQISRELATDTGIDLLSFLSFQAGRAVGNAFGADIIVGSGSSRPTGIINSASAGITGASGVGGAMTFDNLIDLYYSVIPQYRAQPETGWLFNDSTGATIRKLKDSTGRYLWEPTLTPGAPDLILGKPVRTDPNMPAVGLGAKSVLFGDFSSYVVRFVNDMRFERSDDYAFGSDMITFRCLMRGDGLLMDQTGAVKTFTGNAA